MELIDKKGYLVHPNGYVEESLELGCGNRKRHPDAIGVDIRDFPGVDLVGDAQKVLQAIPTGTISSVYTYHFLEHLADLEPMVTAVARVLSFGGRFIAVVPHFSNPYFYSDPTHRTFFGLYTFLYFSEDKIFKRKSSPLSEEYIFSSKPCPLDFQVHPTLLRAAYFQEGGGIHL